MFASLSISTTSGSIPITRLSTGNTTVKFYNIFSYTYAKADKCEWHRDSVEFLGYILSADGLTMSEDKIQMIRDWPVP
jgi:hypothetical protein